MQNGNGGNRPIRTRDRNQPEARPTIGTGYLLRDSTWIIGGQLTTQLKCRWEAYFYANGRRGANNYSQYNPILSKLFKFS